MTSDGEDLLRRAFTAGSVSATAGLARRTFYDNFETVDDYVDALIGHLSVVSAREFEPSVPDLLDAHGGNLRAVTESLVSRHLDRINVRAETRAAYVAELVGSADVGAGPSLPWTRLLEVLEQLGYEPVSPLRASDVVAAVQALLDGLALRGSHDELSHTRVAATEAVLGMLATMTTTRYAEHRSDPVDAMSVNVRTAWNERSNDRQVINVRRLVLDTAAELIAEEGADRFDLVLLSEQTGLSVSAIARYVGSRQQILEALLDRVYPGLLIALMRDLQRDPDPTAALNAHFERFEAILAESTAYADAELALRTHSGTVRESEAAKELMAAIGKLLISGSEFPPTPGPDHLAIGEWATRVIAVGVTEEERGWSVSMIASGLRQDEAGI